jgi:hypothetical protein
LHLFQGITNVALEKTLSEAAELAGTASTAFAIKYFCFQFWIKHHFLNKSIPCPALLGISIGRKNIGCKRERLVVSCNKDADSSGKMDS